jgi:hypothetical protein
MRTWRRAGRIPRIGVVVHGPEVVDSSSALKLISYLKGRGEVHAVLGGTMGRVAVMDASLEGLIDISTRRRPSQAIRDLQAVSDLIALLNQAKSRESGLGFGARIASKIDALKPVVQVDCGGRFVAQLAGQSKEFAHSIAEELGLELLALPQRCSISKDGDDVRRHLTGVLPGEPITINGVVIARATESSVEIRAKRGRIIEARGAQLKQHGLEKLPAIDLEKAIIRSGSIRRTRARPRLSGGQGQGAVLIDHCAEEALDAANGASVAVTVGDDTTAIAGDVLARLGIPVIGIVDGDIDRLSRETLMAKGSVLIRVQPESDDEVGRLVKKEIFSGGDRAPLEGNALAGMIVGIAGDRFLHIEHPRA